MHRFFAPAIAPDATAVTLPDDESHHLARVLRLTPGAEVAVFDGIGHEWTARISAVTRHSASLDLIAPRTPAPEPPVHVTLAVGWLKGDQMDTVVRDATMLGVAAIRPIVSEHIDVGERARRAGGPVDRWRRVALASVKQCGRAVVPAILPAADLAAAMGESAADVQIMCVEPAQAGADRPPLPARPSRAVLYVGPEGGWSAGEIADAAACRLVTLSLGPRTLRAETAPTVALSVLWAAWGWG
jgi:16S rRNA (uracil1498-N3)-methyltransferase